jgi:hypothetical protein
LTFSSAAHRRNSLELRSMAASTAAKVILAWIIGRPERAQLPTREYRQPANSVDR